MGERTLFPNASNKETLAYCWRQMQPDRAAFAGSCTAIVLGTLANAVAAPLIFASLLGRIADTGTHQDLWSSYGPLIIAYAVVLAAATVFGRIGGWLNWGATLRSFGRAITNGYDHLIGLSNGWHTDRPSGEVIATLETSTWAFVELIDAMVWGILRISVTTLGAIVVLGIVAWPVALVMATLVAVFAAVLHHRMGRVVAAEKEFSDAHSRATGVIADTIANLTTVRSQAAEGRERNHVGTLVGDSLSADFRARRVFTATRLQMESAMAFFNWAAVAVGIVLALHHVAAAGVVYLILFYATFVGTSLEESFEFIRLMSRAIGRCAKFAGIAATKPDIVDVPGAPDAHGAAGTRRVPEPLVLVSIRRAPLRGVGPPYRGRGARRARRSLGLGQDHADEAHAPLRGSRRRRHRDRRAGHRTRDAAVAAASHRVRPAGPPDAAPDHRREHLLRTGVPGRGRHGPGALRRARRLRGRVRGAPARRLRDRRRRAWAEALGRSAPAGGHRPGDGQGCAASSSWTRPRLLSTRSPSRWYRRPCGT